MTRLIALIISVSVLFAFNGCKYKKQAEYIKKLESELQQDSLRHAAELEAMKAEMQAKIDSIRENCGNNAKGNYCVITGSFRIQQNADNYLLEMQKLGYKAVIIDAPNGFHLVSTFCGQTLQESLSALNAARNNIHPDSWIYVK